MSFEMYKLSRYRVLLVLVLFCTSVFSAGVQFTRQPTTNVNIYAYVGSKVYDGAVTSDVMVKEVEAAFTSLKEKLDEDKVSNAKRPQVVSGLSTGDGKIYFASSMKGSGDVPGAVATALGIDQRVITALQDCATDAVAANRTGEHCNQGKCGEIMVLSHWYEENGASATRAVMRPNPPRAVPVLVARSS